MHRWKESLWLLLFFVGVVCADRGIFSQISSFRLVSGNGFFSVLDDCNLDVRQKIDSIQKKLTQTTQEEERLSLRRQQLVLLKALAEKAEDGPDVTAYQICLEEMVAEYIDMPTATDDVLLALQEGAFLDEPAMRRDFLMRLRATLLKDPTPKRSIALLHMLRGKGEDEVVLLETCRLAAHAFPDTFEVLNLYASVAHAAETSVLVNRDEVAWLQQQLSVCFASPDGRAEVLASLRAVLDASGYAAAEKIYHERMMVFSKPEQQRYISAYWVALLLENSLLDAARPLLNSVLDAQIACLPAGECLLPPGRRLGFLEKAFLLYRESRDLDSMKKIARIVEVFLPLYVPWFKGECWIAQGMTGTSPKPMVRVPYVAGAQVVCDGEASERVWRSIRLLPGPFYHYPNPVDVKTVDAGSGQADPEYRFFHDGRWLYMFARIPETRMEHLVATHHSGELTLWHDDSLELYFSAFRQMGRYCQWMVNCEGEASFLEYEIKSLADEALPVKEAARLRGPVEEVIKARKDRHAWMVEMKVPFSALELSMPADGSPAVASMAVRSHRRAGGADEPELLSWIQILKGTHYQQTRGFMIFEPVVSVSGK